MIKNEEIILKHLEDLEDPRVLFNQVMFYADKTRKNPWECMSFVFNQNNHTVVIHHKEKIIGYICVAESGPNQLFIFHALCKYGVEDKPKLLNDMLKKIGTKLGTTISKGIMESDRPYRAWEKWGFKPSNMILYEKEVV